MARMTIKEMRQFEALVGEATKAFASLNKTMKDMDPKKIAETNKEIKTLNDAVGDVGTGLGHLKSMWKASPKDIGKSAEAAQKWSIEVKSALESAGKMKGAMGAAAKAAGALGGIVGGISKSLLGMPGLVLMGVKAVIDTATKIDTYVKGMNKDFARVRGPQIMTRDIGKQFKDFNSAVTSIGDNLRDGLQVSEVKAFMESMTGAGLRITTLNEGFYSYRDAVHVAAKASKVFGTDMIATAAMMSKMIIDFKMDLGDVDDSFVQVAFDAEKSGMSTDRFWGAIQNASASLSFYGAFIKGVSKNIKTFSETQVTGAEESVQAIDQMTKMFSKNATQTNMAFIEIAKKGGKTTADLRKKFKEVADLYKGKSADIELRIAASKDAVEIEKLRDEQKRYNMLSTRAQNASVAPTIGMAQEMGLLADQTPELLLDLIKGIHNNNLSTNLLGEPLEAIIKGVEGVSKGQISQDLVKQMYAATKSSADQLIRVVTGINDLTTIGSNTLDDLIAINENTSPETLNEISGLLSEQTGLDKASTDFLAKAAAADSGFARFFAEQVSLAKEGKLTNEQLLSKMEAYRRGTDIGTKIMKYSYKKEEVSSKKMKDAYDDTFEQVRNQTLSIEDMKNIAKDGFKWQLAMITGVTDISTGVSALVGQFVGKKETAEALSARKALPEGMAEDVKKRGAATVAFEITERKKQLQATLEAQKKGAAGTIQSAEAFFKGKAEIVPGAEEKGPVIIADKIDTLVGYLQSQAAKTKDAEQKNILEDLVNKVKWSGKTGVLSLKEFSRATDEAKKGTKDQISETEEQIATADKQLKNLATIDESSQTIADLTAIAITGNEEGKINLAKNIMEKFKGQRVNISEIKKYATESGYAAVKDLLPNLSGDYADFRTKKKAGDVKEVFTGGMVNVSRGDVVVDKESLANALAGSRGSAIPMIAESPAATPAGGAGGGNISIQVTATEKDLAQRIANEVRAVLYKQQVTGMA
jgi:hypothetical protein